MHWLTTFLALAMASRVPAPVETRHADLPDPDFDFHTFVCTWGHTTTPEFDRFLDAAKPEIVQVGFYGPLFHGYADSEKATGYPMRLPVRGQREALKVQTEVNRSIHAKGLKVVGHFQMVNVIAQTNEWNYFLDFYDHHWPEDLLGPKPHEDVRELLQRDVDGRILTRRHYVDYVGLCPSSPYARQMLKQMLKVAIDAGVDGIMANYNYRWGCECPYCQEAFRTYLGSKYTASEIASKFGIEDLAHHTFTNIAARIPGYPATNAVPLDWEAMRWGARAFKEAFDEVLIDYGRSLKPNLIVATWDHIGNTRVTEERSFTPIDLWGRGENYFWYSGGYGPTDLANGKLGDGWMNCLYIRALSGGKPFMLGKYEPVRMRNSMAEGLATGGSGMGLYMNFMEPAGFEAGTEMMQFAHRHKRLYSVETPWAEVALVLPRESVQSGHRESMDAFREAGEALAADHVLFDVKVDQMLRDGLDGYAVAVLPDAPVLSDAACEALGRFVAAGGALIVTGESADGMTTERCMERVAGGQALATSAQVIHLPQADANALIATLNTFVGDRLSRIEAPWTVRVAGYRGGRRLTVHVVNYNRDEARAAEEKLKGPAAELPLPATGIGMQLRIPGDDRVRRVKVWSPGAEKAKEVDFGMSGGTLTFELPSVLVYSIVEIDL